MRVISPLQNLCYRYCLKEKDNQYRIFLLCFKRRISKSGSPTNRYPRFWLAIDKPLLRNLSTRDQIPTRDIFKRSAI